MYAIGNNFRNLLSQAMVFCASNVSLWKSNLAIYDRIAKTWADVPSFDDRISPASPHFPVQERCNGCKIIST
jgi:hypothetical protein